jgi:hypothetical protein
MDFVPPFVRKNCKSSFGLCLILQGAVVFHPLLARPMAVKQQPPFVDIEEVEVSPEFAAVRKAIVSLEKGTMKAFVQSSIRTVSIQRNSVIKNPMFVSHAQNPLRLSSQSEKENDHLYI